MEKGETKKTDYSLDQLGIIYGTDKCSKIGHSYLLLYEKHLPRYPKRFMELGVEYGESLKMWQHWFGHKTELWYLDLFENPDFFSETDCHVHGVKTIKGSQADLVLLDSIKEHFDVIIDDASHIPFFQLVSFKKLFFHNLESGGIYVCEDCHTSLPSQKWFWGPYTQRFEDTFLHMILEYIATKKIVNPYFSKEESDRLESMIESCDLYQGKIVFIKKK